MQPTQAAAQPEMTTHDPFFGAAEKVEQEAIANAERIAGDSRFSDQHKVDEFQKYMGEFRAWIEEHAAAAEQRLTKEVETLTFKASIPLAPSVEEAGVLSYTKDLILQQWEMWKLEGKPRRVIGGPVEEVMVKAAVSNIGNVSRYHKQMQEAWALAIRQGDKVTARVYKDFAESFIRQNRNISADDSLPSMFDFVGELQEKTLDMLRNDEQRQAAKGLRQARYDLAQVKKTLNGARFRLENSRLEAGKVNQKPRIKIQF